MTASIDEVLSTRVTIKAVSQVAEASSFILKWFGMQPGGPNVLPVGHRFFGYDVFNHTRKVGQGRAPEASSATIRANAVGRVDGTFPRLFNKIPILGEKVHNLRVIGGPANVFDTNGAVYIRKQQEYAGELAANFRALLVGGMMRGALYGHMSGDDIYWNYTSSGANYTINYQMPTGNQNQLNMLGAGNIIDVSWDNPAANIPQHILSVNEAFLNLAGTQLKNIWITTKTWQRILNNDYVVSQAGAANTGFDTFKREMGTGPDGTPINVMIGVLKSIPFVEFVINDEVLEIGTPGGETKTKFIDDNAAWFGPEPSDTYFQMLEGSEPASEGIGLEPTEVTGLRAWTSPMYDPFGWNLYFLDNALPANYTPNATAYGTVVF